MAKGFNLTNRAKEDLRGIWHYTFLQYCFPHRSHVVFYLIRENTIDIIGVPHKYMDTESYFS